MITAILITLIMIAMVGVAGAEDGHGMVASVHPTAMEAGLGVLKPKLSQTGALASAVPGALAADEFAAEH